MFDERDPLDALKFANAVLGELGGVVERCNGAIDKFTGDGFLAHFGINSASLFHAREAANCALLMRDKLNLLNSMRYLEDQPVISIGVGINSGTVAAGLIETGYKREHTVVGTTVNVAARIEGLTKLFSVDCLLTASTKALLKEEFLLQAMPSKTVRGIKAMIETYWLLPINPCPNIGVSHGNF